jgi:hypothetical protein
MEMLHGLASSLFGFLHDSLPSPPGFWTDAASAMDSLVGQVGAPIRNFLPLGPLAAAGVFVTGLIVAMGVLRLARRVLSLFTGGGGNA